MSDRDQLISLTRNKAPRKKGILRQIGKKFGKLNIFGTHKPSQKTNNNVLQVLSGQTSKTKKFKFVEKIANFEEESHNFPGGYNIEGVEIMLENEKKSGSCFVCAGNLNDRMSTKATCARCTNSFHFRCLNDFLEFANKGPGCSNVSGPCPNGYMSVARERGMSCAGYNECGTLIVKYELLPGNQRPHHPNPGAGYQGDTVIAYLPDSDQGRRVLGLLKKAWGLKMTFGVGTYPVSKLNDVAVWNISHKTSRFGGHHGYPDASYLERVEDELRALSIKVED